MWIVGLSIDFYCIYTDQMIFFYPLTLPLTENLFALLHFQMNIIYYF